MTKDYGLWPGTSAPKIKATYTRIKSVLVKTAIWLAVTAKGLV